MSQILLVVFGALGGFAVHAVSMKVSFKQRTIDNKIKVYDALIGTWVSMRNYIYAHHTGQPIATVSTEVAQQFDQMYGTSQQLVGEAILVCEDNHLTSEINDLNERLYRTEWHRLSLDRANSEMEEIKIAAFAIASRMRDDIKASTRFEWRDLVHALSGFAPQRSRKRN